MEPYPAVVLAGKPAAASWHRRVRSCAGTPSVVQFTEHANVIHGPQNGRRMIVISSWTPSTLLADFTLCRPRQIAVHSRHVRPIKRLRKTFISC